MKSDPVQDYILKSERNLGVAAAIAAAWPEAREQLVTGFLHRLDARLMKKLKGWRSCRYDGRFFVDAYPGYCFWKPAWENQYAIGLQSRENSEVIALGVSREIEHIGKRPHSPELFTAFQVLHSAATTHQWWEARATMRSPAADWRKPEVLWRMHKDRKFLDEVAGQLLAVAEKCAPIVDKLVRNYRKAAR